MSFALRPILGVLVAVLLAGPAFANNASVMSATSIVQAPKKEGSRWSGFINTSRSTNLINHNDGKSGDFLDHAARVNYKISHNFSLRADSGYSQNLKNSESDDFTNTTFTLVRRPFAMGKSFLLNYQTSLVAPTSKAAHKAQSLLTAIGIGSNLIINPDLLISGLEITGGLKFNRNFHKYETAISGPVNTQHSSTQNLSFAYSFTSGIALSASFTHMNTWSYNNVMRDYFDFTQEISYEINRTLTIAAGHTNSGATLKSNGTDSNIALLDENASLVYGSLTLVF